MNAIERAQADVDRGDLGSARRRLGSFIGSTRYNPEVLARAAEISMQMRDPVQAGRYWLLTPTTGQPVEAVIEAFARACHHDARMMAAELPRFPRRFKMTEYPDVVRKRLARYGIDEVFTGQDPELARVPKTGWKQKAKVLGCLVVGVGFVALVFFGVRALARWGCVCR